MLGDVIRSHYSINPLSWTELVSCLNNSLAVYLCVCERLTVWECAAEKDRALTRGEMKPKSMWLIHVNCCPLVSVPQLSLLCWYTRFWAPPLCPGDESPTSIERQIQTPAASQLHTAVTSGPDTATKKNKKKLDLQWGALPPQLPPPPQSSGGNWRILTRLWWCIKDKQEVTDFVMNSPSCIFLRDLEASRSLHCKTAGRCLHTDVLLTLRSRGLLRSL